MFSNILARNKKCHKNIYKNRSEDLGQTLPLTTATDWLSQKLQIPFGFVMKLKLFVIGYNSPRAKVMDLNINLEYIFDKTIKIMNYFQCFGIFIEKLENHVFFKKIANLFSPS